MERENEDARAVQKISIIINEFDRERDTIGIRFIPATGKGSGQGFQLSVPADAAADRWLFVEYCRPRFSHRQVGFNQDSLEAGWDAQRNVIFARIEGRPFRFGDCEKTHLTGRLICPACHTGCGVPCLEDDCLGTIHIDFEAVSSPRGSDNTTSVRVVSECDRCAGRAESTVRLDELRRMIQQKFGTVTEIVNATGERKATIIAGLRELWREIRERPLPVA